MFCRAHRFQIGYNEPENYPEAIILYEQAIQLGLADAMMYRAIMHEDGLGEPCNFPAAINLHERAHRLDKTLGASNISSLFRREFFDKKMIDQLVDIIWDDLINGLTFTEHTLKKCTKEIIKRFYDQNLNTSVIFLKQLQNNSNHPMVFVLNEIGFDIKNQYHNVRNTHLTFFSLCKYPGSSLHNMPKNMRNLINSIVHPGAEHDETVNNRTRCSNP